MGINNEEEFSSSVSEPKQATEEEFRSWEAGLMRGVGIARTGNVETRRGENNTWENVYEVVDKEFATPVPSATAAHQAGCQCLQCQQKAYRYMTWHRTNHRNIPSQACEICKAETLFKSQHPELVGRRVGVEG